MTDLFIDYTTIKNDAVAAITAAGLGFKKVIKDATDRDYEIPNMPMADVRLKRVVPQAVAGQTYYGDVTLEIEIAVFDLTNREEAATIRDNLASALQRFFQVTPHFGASIDTTLVGNADFDTGESKAQGAFVASAVCEFHVFLYRDR